MFLALVCPGRMLQARPGREEELGRPVQKRIREYYLPFSCGSTPRLALSHCFGVRDEKKAGHPHQKRAAQRCTPRQCWEAGSDHSAMAPTRHHMVLPLPISYRQPFELQGEEL